MTDLPKLLTTERAVEHSGCASVGQFRRFAKRHGLRPFDAETRPHLWKRADIDRIIDPDLDQSDSIMESIRSYAR